MGLISVSHGAKLKHRFLFQNVHGVGSAKSQRRSFHGLRTRRPQRAEHLPAHGQAATLQRGWHAGGRARSVRARERERGARAARGVCLRVSAGSSASWGACALRPAGRRRPACSACERAGPGGALSRLAAASRSCDRRPGLCVRRAGADGRNAQRARVRAPACRPPSRSLPLCTTADCSRACSTSKQQLSVRGHRAHAAQGPACP
jgi:hypothetical protein